MGTGHDRGGSLDSKRKWDGGTDTTARWDGRCGSRRPRVGRARTSVGSVGPRTGKRETHGGSLEWVGVGHPNVDLEVPRGPRDTQGGRVKTRLWDRSVPKRQGERRWLNDGFCWSTPWKHVLVDARRGAPPVDRRRGGVCETCRYPVTEEVDFYVGRGGLSSDEWTGVLSERVWGAS